MSFNVKGFIQAMKDNGITNQQLMDILKNKYDIDITLDGVKSYRRTNQSTTPSADKIVAISKILRVSADFLLGIEERIKPVQRIPIIGTASCGGLDTNHLQELNTYAYFNSSLIKKDCYCLIANGDSMSPEIEDGDQILCDPNEEIFNGDIVHYQLLGESAVKVYYKDEDAYIVQFIPYNVSETFKTKTIRLDDEIADELKISKVIAINKLKNNNRLSRLKMIGKA